MSKKCNVVIPNRAKQTITRCGKLCEGHTPDEIEDSDQLKRKMRVAFVACEKAIGYAYGKDYDKLQEILFNHESRDSTIHDIIARIAVREGDEKLFNMTDHHPRMLMEEFAPDEKNFPTLIRFYKNDKLLHDDGYWDIPSYVWANLTLRNAIMLQRETGKDPELSECSVEIQDHFNYDEIYTLHMICETHGIKEGSDVMDPEEVMSRIGYFLYEDVKHSLTCGLHMYIQKRDEPKMPIDAFIKCTIFFEGKEFSKLQDLEQLDKPCPNQHDEGDQVCELCECNIEYGKHVEDALNELDDSNDYERLEDGFVIKCKTYPVKVVFKYDAAMFDSL
jgi:hypothetical protein